MMPIPISSESYLPWIPLAVDLENDPKTLDLAGRLLALPAAERCPFWRPETTHHLLSDIWSWAARKARTGDLANHSDFVIARAMHWTGNASALVKALLESRWLDEDRQIHDWGHINRAHVEAALREEATRPVRQQPGARGSGPRGGLTSTERSANRRAKERGLPPPFTGATDATDSATDATVEVVADPLHATGSPTPLPEKKELEKEEKNTDHARAGMQRIATDGATATASVAPLHVLPGGNTPRPPPPLPPTTAQPTAPMAIPEATLQELYGLLRAHDKTGLWKPYAWNGSGYWMQRAFGQSPLADLPDPVRIFRDEVVPGLVADTLVGPLTRNWTLETLLRSKNLERAIRATRLRKQGLDPDAKDGPKPKDPLSRPRSQVVQLPPSQVRSQEDVQRALRERARPVFGERPAETDDTRTEAP